MPDKAAIVVNGAGLAGTACAIRLRQLGHAVTLIDQARFPRRKLCGEFLGPDAMPVLKKLGLLDSVIAESAAPIEAVHLYNAKGKALRVKLAWFRADYPFALALPRAILDTLLVRHAQTLGAAMHEGTEIYQCLYDQAQGRFELAIQSTEPNQPALNAIQTTLLIDASGRNSRLASLLNTRSSAPDQLKKIPQRLPLNRVEPHVGVQCHVSLNCDSTDLSMYFFPGGYGGIQSISADTANLCMWLTPTLAQQSRQDFKTFLKSTLGKNAAAHALIDSIQYFEPVKTVAGVHALHQRRPASESILSVGDALLAVEPFSGFGMSHALHTGVLAAECIDRGLRADHSYQQILRHYMRLYQAQFQAQLGVLRWIRPFLNQPLLQQVSWPLLPPLMPLLTKLYR